MRDARDQLRVALAAATFRQSVPADGRVVDEVVDGAADRLDRPPGSTNMHQAVGAGELKVQEREYALHDARVAHDDLEGRRTTGKPSSSPKAGRSRSDRCRCQRALWSSTGRGESQ